MAFSGEAVALLALIVRPSEEKEFELESVSSVVVVLVLVLVVVTPPEEFPDEEDEEFELEEALKVPEPLVESVEVSGRGPWLLHAAVLAERPLALWNQLRRLLLLTKAKGVTGFVAAQVDDQITRHHEPVLGGVHGEGGGGGGGGEGDDASGGKRIGGDILVTSETRGEISPEQANL
ncbi:hypothetical protein TYRP_015666 [Tyrophagus putrescentiae]|nr:hypothetical protein TYRP_015666 [Tyrophagus putrescentiae]